LTRGNLYAFFMAPGEKLRPYLLAGNYCGGIMNAMQIVAGVLATLLFVYLVVAMIRAEDL
jgi:K+-transporting ATPase KdpF subunit